MLAAAFRDLAMAMDYRFLFDTDRQLLSIGYLPSDGQRDPNCYDLLASEARLASFFAIAKGDIPTKHWFRMGRVTTEVAGGAALVSWSGSMFEYLMPSLVMRAPDKSLLAETNRLVVARQIEYGRSKGIPWGISEFAYNARNFEFTYQYSNFGVPGLGLKRGLSANTVIAPYATGLATMIDPSAAAENYRALAAEGAVGAYGYYEAIDFTPGRVPIGETFAIVRNYMAHHQGMTIVALADALLGGEMRRRFHREPIIGAVELLLQERHPREATAIHVRAEEVSAATEIRIVAPQTPRRTETAAHGRTANPDPFQRPLLGHADQCRLGLQPVERVRCHTLAGGPDARRLGLLHLSPRYSGKPRLVGDLPADAERARHLFRKFLRGPRRVCSPRPHDHYDDRGCRLG